jgi:hypothetical protein
MLRGREKEVVPKLGYKNKVANLWCLVFIPC